MLVLVYGSKRKTLDWNRDKSHENFYNIVKHKDAIRGSLGALRTLGFIFILFRSREHWGVITLKKV